MCSANTNQKGFVTYSGPLSPEWDKRYVQWKKAVGRSKTLVKGSSGLESCHTGEPLGDFRECNVDEVVVLASSPVCSSTKLNANK